MKKLFDHFFAGFDYENSHEFLLSLIPTIKYQLGTIVIFTFSFSAIIDQVFGLDAAAVLALILAMCVELISGIYASSVLAVPFNSKRLSRFTVKSACYLILIAVPFLLQKSYIKHDNSVASMAFGWLHVFLVTQIAIEHIVSILENVAVISGKPKTYWVTKIKSKIDEIVS